MTFPNISKIADALTRVTENVGHYEACDKTDKYIVWAEDMESSCISADNKKQQQAIQGTIDYFTRQEYDQNVPRIQEELDAEKISYFLNSIQYEDETGFIHYEWVWEVS